MTYQETIAYLFAAAPLFQQVGGDAYKEGLSTTHALDEHFGHPHRGYATIHIAGTNGKGSCAHTIAAILQARGLRVGLYTSPHLKDFRERIRVNGEMMPEEAVIDFVEHERAFFEPLHPSFFELTTALAFKYFAEAKVDVAVIEVGLGGRLDCTNIITPMLSVITNISLDHTTFLGETLAEIAGEKAGIIKPSVPVVIGEALPETRPVFEKEANKKGAPIIFAEDCPEVIQSTVTDKDYGLRIYETRSFGELVGELTGECQTKNTNTILTALQQLIPRFDLREEDIREGFRHVASLTGLRGRWQVVERQPLTVIDTGHNPGGWIYLGHQLTEAAERHHRLHIVFGMAADKDVDSVLSLLPNNAEYYWTQASVRRAMPSETLQNLAARHGLNGKPYPDVRTAYLAARAASQPDDFIFVGGSCFVVADF